MAWGQSGQLGSPRASQAYSLTTKHGPTYRLARLFLAVAAFFAVALGAVSALDTTSALTTKVAVVGAFASVAVAGVAWASFARRERTFVVDEAGVHLSRNHKARLDVPWDEVDEVEYGTVPWESDWPKWVLDPQDVIGPDWHTYIDASNPRRFLLPYLSISRRKGRPIRLVERLVDDIPRGSLSGAVRAVKTFATAHSVPVRKTVAPPPLGGPWGGHLPPL